jgi:hypothetical protein
MIIKVMKLSKRPRAGKIGLFIIIVLVAGVATPFTSPEIKNPAVTGKLISYKDTARKGFNENIIGHQDRVNQILDLKPLVFP